MLTPKLLTFLVGLLFSTCLAIAGDPGVYTPQPNIVAQITSALMASKLDHLTPHTYQDGGSKFSYNLQSVTCLGTIERGTERFVLATALFIRSSAEKSEFPPPRYHGYILCLSTKFKLISHCQLDFPQVELIGTKLLRAKETITDFSDSDVATRRRGFLIDGANFLPYPFADRLPEAPQ